MSGIKADDKQRFLPIKIERKDSGWAVKCLAIRGQEVENIAEIWINKLGENDLSEEDKNNAYDNLVEAFN